MPFVDYTTPAEVRSLLGAGSKEVTDDVISTNTNLTRILESLDALDPTAAAIYFAARDAEPPTTDQARYILLIQSFSSYVAAVNMVPALPNLIAKRITDGKSEIERHNPYESLLPDLEKTLAWLRTRIQRQLRALNGQPEPGAAPRRMVANVPLGIDPITG